MKYRFNNLKESSNLLQTLLKNIPSAVFLINDSFKIYEFNDSLQQLLNKDRKEILKDILGNVFGCIYAVKEKKSCGKTSHCHECPIRETLTKTLFQHISTEKKIIHRKFYITKKPVDKYFLYSTKYICFQGKNMALVVLDDITELNKKNLELIELNKKKNEFVGMAAHDLRNPLSIINMYSIYVLEELNYGLITKETINFINTIYESSEFMLTLLNDLLDISAIESQKLKLHKEKVNYTELIINNIKLNRILSKKKKIAIDLNVKNKIPELYIDEDKIVQVLNNFISNAIKYSHSKTTITAEVKADSKFVTTKIIDQGQGIPKKELPLVFKAFKKTSVQSTAGEKSTGLGLAITQKIVKVHKGKIGVESQVGKGSTFYFTLPITNKT